MAEAGMTGPHRRAAGQGPPALLAASAALWKSSSEILCSPHSGRASLISGLGLFAHRD